jgi:seryl-tRNA synthetase
LQIDHQRSKPLDRHARHPAQKLGLPYRVMLLCALAT